MTVKVRFPTPLRAKSGQHAAVEGDARTADEPLARHLDPLHEVNPPLLDETGHLRSVGTLSVNETACRALDHRATRPRDGDTLLIVLKAAGG